jgi:hypothetical protein
MYRVLPGSKIGNGVVTSKSGHQFPVASGGSIDLPYEEACTLSGWCIAGRVGTTANRPLNASAGEKYLDTTISKVIVYDGNGSWWDPFNPSAAV